MSDVSAVTRAGSAFQTLGAATGNARPPSDQRRIVCTMRAKVVDVLKCRRELMSATRVWSSTRYDGAMSCKLWKTSTASLNSICCGIRSQCKSRKRGVTLSFQLAVRIDVGRKTSVAVA